MQRVKARVVPSDQLFQQGNMRKVSAPLDDRRSLVLSPRTDDGDKSLCDDQVLCVARPSFG